MLVYKLPKILSMTDRELYQYCQDVGAKARDWKKRFVALLPEVAKRNLHRKFGFASIVDFAGRLGGVGEYTVESVLRIQKYIEDKPALVEALPMVGVHKLRLIATMATKENQEILAKKAQEMSKSALEVWAKEIRPGTEIAKGIFAGKGLTEGQNQLFAGTNGFENLSNMSSFDNRIHYSFDVDKETDFKLRKHKLEIEKDIKRYATWCEVLKKLIDDKENISIGKVKNFESIKNIERIKGTDSNKSIEDIKNTNLKTKQIIPNLSAKNPGDTGISKITPEKTSQNNIDSNNNKQTRYIPESVKQELRKKYDGKCGYPNCNKPSTILHHTKRYALEPNHENIIPLCSEHHEIIHNSWINNETDSPSKWLKGLYEGINKAKEKIDQKVRLYSQAQTPFKTQIVKSVVKHPGSPNTS